LPLTVLVASRIPETKFPVVSSLEFMKLTGEEIVPAAAAEPSQLSKERKVALWLFAWILAGMATMAPGSIASLKDMVSLSIVLFCYSWAFPAGLLAPFGSSDGNSPIPGIGLLIVGWSFYIGLTIYALRQRKSSRYFLIYAILVVLLALNAAGCRYEYTHIKINC